MNRLLRLCATLFATGLVVAGGTFASLGGSAEPAGPAEVRVSSLDADQSMLPVLGGGTERGSEAAPEQSATADDGALRASETSTAQPSSALASVKDAVLPRPAASRVAAPVYSARQVLDLSRDVALPSGRTFSQCAALAGEEWPYAAHDYWVAGTNTWVVETHIGDAGLLFNEISATFTVRNVSRPGC